MELMELMEASQIFKGFALGACGCIVQGFGGML